MNPLTYRLLRVVGSPFAGSNYKPSIVDISGLYQYAAKNKMPLLSLESLRRLGGSGSLEKEYRNLVCKHAKSEKAIHRVSKILDRTGSDYAFFKSIRPYKEVTVDIDILIFGSNYGKVIRAMHRAGYMFLASGPLSATFRDREARIDLDIYEEVGVSYMIYLDKDVLTNFVGYRNLSSGEVVRSLNPEVDLLAIIAHSVVKEHMYVLSEYYTTLYYLANMKSKTLNSFLSLVDKCKMRSAVETHLGITALLHSEAHNFVPGSIIRLLRMLDTDDFELSRVAEMNFCMPYKYHPITTIKALVEKLGEKKARRSFASQALKMLNLGFASSVVKKMLDHLLREAY